MKLGQWARTKYGLGVLLKTDEYGNYLFERFNRETFVCQNDNIGFIADTPQELIQVGDMIVHNEWEDYDELEIVRGILKDGSILLSGSVPVFPEYITEIWTRTNKDTYTRQWKFDNK